jgi:membrane protease YdiL (CAAX protease family)
MNVKKIEYKTFYAIIVFDLIAVATRYLAVKTDILSNANFYLRIIAEGMGPTLGAIVACFVFKLKFRPMTLKGYYKSLLFPSLVYWIIPILLFSLLALITKGTFPVFYVFIIFFYGLLVDIGWRGFLQQQLQGLPKIWNIMIVSILWYVWHLNFDITAMNLIFFGLLIFGSWGMGIVADKTKSLLLVAAFHSLNNVKSESKLIFILIALLFVSWVAIIVYMEKKKGKFVEQAEKEKYKEEE